MAATPLDIRFASNVLRAHPQRDPVLEKHISAACADWFPDNEGNTWHIEGLAHSGDRSFVLVRPEPDDVGYTRFIVLAIFGAGKDPFAAAAMYCEERPGTFGLLGTSDECPSDRPPGVVWS